MPAMTDVVQEYLHPANAARRAAAADRVIPLVQRALNSGRPIRADLRAIAELRVQHPQASLSELGQMVQPPLSKDAVAGRLRRLAAGSVKV